MNGGIPGIPFLLNPGRYTCKILAENGMRLPLQTPETSLKLVVLFKRMVLLTTLLVAVLTYFVY